MVFCSCHRFWQAGDFLADSRVTGETTENYVPSSLLWSHLHSSQQDFNSLKCKTVAWKMKFFVQQYYIFKAHFIWRSQYPIKSLALFKKRKRKAYLRPSAELHPRMASNQFVTWKQTKNIIRQLILTHSNWHTKHTNWYTKLSSIETVMLFPIGPKVMLLGYPCPPTALSPFDSRATQGPLTTLKWFLLMGGLFILLSLVWINRGWPEISV